MKTLTFIVAALAAATFSGCNALKSTSTSRHDSLFLEPVWTRLGDSEGAVDQERGIASVESAEFSPDGKFIVSGAKKGWEVMMWEAATGNKVWEKKLGEEIEAVAFSRDGRYVALGGEDKTIHIWKAGDASEVKLIRLPYAIDGMRFSNKGDLLIGGDEAGMIHVWQTKDWKEIHTVKQGDDQANGGPKGSHADVNSVDFSKDDQYVATAGRNSVVRIWRARDMQLLRTLSGHTGSVKSVRISPDGRWAASASASPDTIKGDNSVRVWDFNTGKQLAHFKHPKGMEAVEFSPDSRFLLAGGRQGGGYEVKAAQTGFIYVYALPASISQPVIPQSKVSVFRSEYLHFNKDGSQLVTSHEDGTLRLWNVRYKD